MQRKSIRTGPREELDADETVGVCKEAGCGVQWRLLGFLLLFRLCNALLSYSAFVPDEYWQGLEVAHRMVFGYGYLTWEWHKPIRGFTHPLMYAAVYKVLALLNLDIPVLLIVLPRVLHAPIAVVGDYFVMKLTTRVFGPSPAKWALLVNVASWFTFYCITRTLSNSIETCLTPVVLYYWILACEENDSGKKRKYTRLYLLVMGVSVLIRPTGAILWPPVVLAQYVIDRHRIAGVLKDTVGTGLLTLAWSVGVDCFFYGKLVIVQWNFLEFNVLEGNSAFYGGHSWHWYFTEDVPVLLFTALPLVAVGVWLAPGGWWKRGPFLLALWELVLHSCLSHKEHRHVLPIVPVASVYAGYGMWWLFNKYGRKLHLLLYGLLLANLPMALYFSLVHQRGTVHVMQHLSNSIDDNSSVLFLMPCHTTPFYSHIHKPITMRFLECPPPIRPDYHDVSKAFYSAPKEWLSSEYPGPDHLPTHLVFFDVLLPAIDKFIQAHRYKQEVELFHTHFPESERYGTHVLVYRL